MDLHKRFLQQAAWTADLRHYLFERAQYSAALRVLEVGCGTGAILQDLEISTHQATPQVHSPPSIVCGIDVSAGALHECRLHAPRAVLARADALALPYPDGCFDITFCHFFLMWVHQPVPALHEMKRVTRRGGQILALAEPDYGSRVDEPPELAVLGALQTRSLRGQGADVDLGSHLPDLFRRAGISVVESDAIQPRVRQQFTPTEAEQEWAVLEAEVERLVSVRELWRLKRLEAKARGTGKRMTYVPTYFAWGQV